MKNTVILGGGMSGIVTASYLANKGIKNLFIIENSNELGGLLRSFDYKEYGSFDYGTHYLASIYPKDIQNILWSSLPESEWNVMEGVNSDVSGLYFNGVLQKETVFPDLRSFDDETYNFLLGSFFKHLEHTNFDDINDKTVNQNAFEYLKNLYGESIVNFIFKPILEKIFKSDINKIDSFAAKLIPIHRLCFFNEKVAKMFLEINEINKTLAYPIQLNLPEKYHPNYFSYYPKIRGIGKVIKNIENTLLNKGVKILKNAKVKNIEIENNQITTVILEDREIETDNVISSMSLVPLHKLFKGEESYKYLSSMDKPNNTVITNIVLKKINNLNGRHYIYCYDSEFETFRITNYEAITGLIEKNKAITVESIHDEKVDKTIIKSKIVNELIKMNIILDINDILFIECEILEKGFPNPSVNNINLLDEMRNDIDSLNIENLTRVGSLSESGIFFMKDVFLNLHNKLNNLKK